MLIDTHCHLDAAEFGAEREAVIARAAAAGVDAIVVPAVDRHNWRLVTELARASQHRDGPPHLYFALGIHPLCVDAAADADLDALRECIDANRNDPRFVGIGEIGLDHFVPGLDRDKQKRFLDAQLRMARDFDCPVILHTRRSVDQVGAAVRRLRPKSGIAHAFNGSAQQAQAMIALNLALGFGGAMTFTRARNIRRLVASIPAESIVLETDAPDIAPEWIAPGRNEPGEISRIAEVMAQVRGTTREQMLSLSSANALRVLPALAALSARAACGDHALG